jgi:hypothetical protein
MIRSAARFALVSLALLLSAPSFAQGAGGAALSDQQLAELGQHWAAAINERDASALTEILNLEFLAARSASTFTNNETERSGFIRGFLGARDNFVRNLLATIEAGGGHALYLKVHTFDGMRGSLVRYDFEEQGTNYLLLLAENVPGSGPRVVDMFVATNGQRLSDTLGAISQLLFNPSESLLGKVFGVHDLDENLAGTFRRIGELQRQGDTVGVYEALAALPETIRNHRVMMNLSVQVASLLSEDTYRQELARLARYHRDDPTAAFMLIDYYFYKGDMQSAMEAVLGMERAFGLDGAIAMLKANIALAAEDVDGAREFAEQSVELEPENETSRWTLVAILMPAEAYEDGIAVLESLEADFGYELDDAFFSDNEAFAGFVESREYAAWMDERE